MKRSLLTVFFIFLFSLGFSQVKKEYRHIYGVWQSSVDPEWTMEFKSNNHCYWSNKGVQQDVYKYSITDSPPECDTRITESSKYGYLKLRNVEDPEDIYCYVIDLLNKKILEVTRLGNKNSGLKIFEKISNN